MYVCACVCVCECLQNKISKWIDICWTETRANLCYTSLYIDIVQEFSALSSSLSENRNLEVSWQRITTAALFARLLCVEDRSLFLPANVTTVAEGRGRVAEW